MHESNLLQFFEMMQLEIETMKFLYMTIKDLGLTIKTTLPYKFSQSTLVDNLGKWILSRVQIKR
jgi:hypothetical protein